MTNADPQLTNTEWAAVSVALQDASRCGCASAPATGAAAGLHRAFAALFGRRRPNPLANPRLEAVRQFVCASRLGRGNTDKLARPLASHGYSPAQIDALGLLAH